MLDYRITQTCVYTYTVEAESLDEAIDISKSTPVWNLEDAEFVSQSTNAESID